MAVQSFKDLSVWRKSFKLAELVYKITQNLPKEEKFGITNQLQRTAISIPSNIAEGCSRNSRKEFLQFIGVARGSAAELETQLLLAKSIYRLDLNTELELLTEIQKMLTKLSQSLRS